MKISFFDDEPEIYPIQYGGKARTITNLAKEFIKLKEVEKVTILSRSIISSRKEFTIEGVDYIVLDDNNTISKIAEEMNNTDIFNIHCCSFTFPDIKGRAKKFYFLHDVLIATAEKGSHLDKSLGGNFDAILAPSEFSKSVYEKNKKIIKRETPCHVIPRNINTDLFYYMEKEKIENDEKAPELVKKLINKYNCILFFPNRPIEEKGGKYLEQISKILDSKLENYCIIGPFEENKNFPKNCINTGWIESDKLKYYYSISNATLNFSCLPESFSQVCIESVYCKTPVVAFKSGNIPDLAKIIQNVILVDKNSDSIIKGIMKAISIEDNKLSIGKEQIEENFATNEIISRYMKIYKEYMEK